MNAIDHERIWLQNAEDARLQDEGRMWCQDKVWPDEDGDGEPTEYVRADLYAAKDTALAEMRAELERQQDEEDKAARDMQVVIQALRDRATAAEAELVRARKALILMPMAARVAELPHFMAALAEWGCTDPNEQAQAITEFLNSLVGLREYLEDGRALGPSLLDEGVKR